MTRQERAKQFMPFDAMKGLKEALLKREEQHSRVEKRDLSDDEAEELSRTISKLVPRMIIEIECYKSCHDIIIRGAIEKIDIVYKYLIVNKEKIFFDDLYKIKIL